jgi:RNA polymerase sigma factor (sigma-70 family)
MLTKLLRAAAARSRPPRAEVEPVALELIGRYGGEIMAAARRYSQTREDAEDAYQRGLEILLTKAPSTEHDDLLPWLKTVVKHEAFSLRRQRERAGQPAPPDQIASHTAAGPTAPHDQVEMLERLQLGAEALGRLKPQEIRCIQLLAEGHTYKQIQAITGFSYTKVNRCLAEGRRSFLRRVERIESGAECERLAPLLSALADGEASADDMAVLRPHLRTCLSCRATLRDAREVPARVAALAPVGLLVVGHSAPPARLLRSLGSWLQDRATVLMLRSQDVLEAASAHKLAAAAASAAALGGGGVVTVAVQHPAGPPPHPHAAVRAAAARRPPPPWRPAAMVVPPAPAVAARPRAAAPRKHRAARSAARTAPEPATPTAVAPVPEPAARVGPRPREKATRPSPQTGEFGP